MLSGSVIINKIRIIAAIKGVLIIAHGNWMLFLFARICALSTTILFILFLGWLEQSGGWGTLFSRPRDLIQTDRVLTYVPTNALQQGGSIPNRGVRPVVFRAVSPSALCPRVRADRGHARGSKAYWTQRCPYVLDPLVLRLVQGAVSYTHLTLPTKRIV